MSADLDRTRRLLPATLGALVVAALILVTLVLPAEFGIDPLGTGQALGLTGLAETPAAALEAQPGPLRRDSARFELASFESVELKYRLAEGSAMAFSWSASGNVTFDLHAEPEGAPEGFAESFDRGKSEGASGVYRAEFSGIHGWFWENRNPTPLVVEVQAAGFFSGAIEYRDGWETEREPPAVGGGSSSAGSGEPGVEETP